jgi:hypothetical protein
VSDTCQNWKPNTFAYFLQARIVNQRCDEPAEWIVKVNPPKEGNDGCVRLCDLCNRFEYQTFSRERIQQPTEAKV